MTGNNTINAQQIIVNVSDSIPPENLATIDKGSLVGNAVSKEQFQNQFDAKSDEIDEKFEELKDQVESNFKGVLKPTDTAPTEDGSYKPALSSKDNIGTDPENYGTLYANAGNLRAKEGYDTMFYKKGTAWTKAESKMPESLAKIPTWAAGNYSVGNQVIYSDQAVYEANTVVSATDIPGTSTKWTKKVGDIDSRIALRSLLNTENKTETLVKTLTISDTSPANYNIFGVQNTYQRYLTTNNTSVGYATSGEYFNVWMNIPVKANNIGKIELSIIPYGSPNGAVDKSNLVGVKNGNVTPLITWPNVAPNTLQTFIIDVSQYDTVSLGLYVLDSKPVTNTQTVKFYKVEGGTTKVDAVQEYIDLKTKNLSMWMNVKNEGAKGDGSTDDTAAINAAIVKLFSQGGGVLYFPAGIYNVTQITIPSNNAWQTIELRGEFSPAQRFGTIDPNGWTPSGFYNFKNGTIIRSTSDTVTAVINVATGPMYQGFNSPMLIVSDLTVRTAVENPNIDGINAYYAFQLICEGVVVDTGVYNVLAIEPTKGKSGIVTPKNQNCAVTYLRNLSISGFSHGIRVFEHTNGDSLQIQSCKNALTFEFADHSSRFGRCCFQRNTNQINVVGEHLFIIDQLNMEYAGPGQTTPTNAWQSTQWEINDPQNLGIGNITYANVKGAVGKVTTWRMNGASKVICKRVGAENRTTATIPSP